MESAGGGWSAAEQQDAAGEVRARSTARPSPLILVFDGLRRREVVRRAARGLTAPLVALTVGVLAPTAFGCECPTVSPRPSEIESIQLHTAWSTAVFRATVVSLDVLGPEYRDDPIPLPDGGSIPRKIHLFPGYRVSFQVRDVWKGSIGASQLVISDDGTCRCKFSPGEEYLVFADSRKGQSDLYTNLCSGNRAVPEKAVLDRALGKPRKHYGSK